ncbi:MAG: thiamine pyrophosphate-binding protein [Candidatus Gastranaerophilaceae bacterium]
MKVSDYIIKFINEKMGVKHVFILSGGGWMHLLNSLGENKKIEYICNLHEQAAAIAAEAYGEYTNNIGVAIVTTGPGGTNAITGVAAAWIDSTPMIVFSGQVKRADMIGDKNIRQMGPQEVDIVPIVKPITKYAESVLDPLKIRYHLEKAYYLATTGKKGPVWLDVPLDVQGATVDEKKLKGFTPEKEDKKDKDFDNKIRKTIELINKAKRPVILAGNGIYLSGAKKEFLQLAEKLDIPILTTWKYIDLIEQDNRLFAGRPGSIASRSANFTLQNADLLITIGARMDLPQTAFNHKNFGKNAKKIIVDIDENEIKKMQMDIEIKFVSDAKDFISEVWKNKDKITYKNNDWIEKCNELKEKYPIVLPEFLEQKEYINSYVLLDVLSQEMSKNDMLVPGSSGSCSEVSMQSFKVKKGQVVLNNQGLGSMGFGLPASIGACIASGRKTTVCVNGDGGFMMNIQDLETVKRLNLPIKFFILNNDGYASIRNMQNSHFHSLYVGSGRTSGVTLPDMQKIAKAFDIPSKLIKTQQNLNEEVKAILKSEGPFLCEVIINPNQQTQPRVSSIKLEDGSMMSKPIEDMWPFLPKEEIEANMV